MSTVTHSEPVIEDIELKPLDIKGELLLAGDDETPEPENSLWMRHGLFFLTFLIPVALAGFYFFIIEAPRFVSEAHFIVRSSSAAAQGAGLTAMIANEGLSRATDETYAVNDYLTSRDILALLIRNDGLRAILSRPEADFVNRFPNFYTRDNFENLYERFQSMVTARIDAATGISIVRINAFRPGDARAIAAAILKYGEGMINTLNDRAFNDAERYAQSIVDRERANISDIEEQLTRYRNASGTVDPSKEAIASFELVGKMTTELALLQAQVTQQSALAPNDPNIPAMRQRIAAYQGEIDRQKRQIVGGDTSIAAKLDGYERLAFERELAGRALGLAMISLTKAREDANQQHLYLQTIVEPNTPDERDYWRLIYGMGAVIAVGLAVFVIARSAGAIIMEHSA